MISCWIDCFEKLIHYDIQDPQMCNPTDLCAPPHIYCYNPFIASMRLTFLVLIYEIALWLYKSIYCSQSRSIVQSIELPVVSEHMSESERAERESDSEQSRCVEADYRCQTDEVGVANRVGWLAEVRWVTALEGNMAAGKSRPGGGHKIVQSLLDKYNNCSNTVYLTKQISKHIWEEDEDLTLSHNRPAETCSYL